MAVERVALIENDIELASLEETATVGAETEAGVTGGGGGDWGKGTTHLRNVENKADVEGDDDDDADADDGEQENEEREEEAEAEIETETAGVDEVAMQTVSDDADDEAADDEADDDDDGASLRLLCKAAAPTTPTPDVTYKG